MQRATDSTASPAPTPAPTGNNTMRQQAAQTSRASSSMSASNLSSTAPDKNRLRPEAEPPDGHEQAPFLETRTPLFLNYMQVPHSHNNTEAFDEDGGGTNSNEQQPVYGMHNAPFPHDNVEQEQWPSPIPFRGNNGNEQQPVYGMPEGGMHLLVAAAVFLDAGPYSAPHLNNQQVQALQVDEPPDLPPAIPFDGGGNEQPPVQDMPAGVRNHPALANPFHDFEQTQSNNSRE